MTQPTLTLAVAAEVRAEAARQHITAEQIGKWIGRSGNQAGERLNGRIEFKLSEIQAIAEQFGKPVSQFLGTQNGSAA